MPYITREDGEHFVIPSYRDVLAAKNKNLLKRDILLLSQNYGEYITLQRKGPNQYEVAFSPDTGYLLGESIWHYFKRPVDMIYCEAIPNTTEALLVIVKSSSVYLDGSFPLDSIPEELIIFLTQQNNFEIYIHGDVPISQLPTEGKFNFETSSVKSFTVLDKPVFPTLPLLKIYQLQLVDPVLKAHGIGVFPTRQVITTIIILALLWMTYSYWSSHRKPAPVPFYTENPYQGYNAALNSPAPDEQINQIQSFISLLLTMPGWTGNKISFDNNVVTANVKSGGGKIEDLMNWAQNNGLNVDITPQGINLSSPLSIPKRPVPRHIYAVKEVIGKFVDKLATVYPGNKLQIGEMASKGVYLDVNVIINLEGISPVVFGLIGDQFKDLPFVLQKLDMTMDKGNLTGSITMEALGS